MASQLHAASISEQARRVTDAVDMLWAGPEHELQHPGLVRRDGFGQETLPRPLLANQSRLVALQKFVSTTVRPTLLPYTELYHWDGCASFISDYLIMEPLKSPITPVRKGLQSSQKQPHNSGDRSASQQDTTWKPQWLALPL